MSVTGFERFYARYGPDVQNGGGVSAKRMMLDRRGGGSKKSVFGRTSLMDDL